MSSSLISARCDELLQLGRPRRRRRSRAGGPSSQIRPWCMNTIAVRDRARELHLVGDEDHRHALLREVGDDLQHLALELRIEGRRDLVEQHDLRREREAARDRDALLLAAGELVRIGVALLDEARPAPAPRSAISRASASGIFVTTVSPMVMLRSTVRCGNRLKLWKTKPTSLAQRPQGALVADERACRSRRSRRPGSASRPLMQRSIVLLPEPLRPMMTTTLPARRRARRRLQHLEAAPNCLRTRRSD